MDSFYIGISGLDAAQKAISVIGNNLANAATEGYHRQRIELRPSYTSEYGSVILGGGVEVVGITRMIDSLLEKESIVFWRRRFSSSSHRWGSFHESWIALPASRPLSASFQKPAA
ncbi:MAG: flagellar basal body protein [Planctomycetota bacterium]